MPPPQKKNATKLLSRQKFGKVSFFVFNFCFFEGHFVTELNLFLLNQLEILFLYTHYLTLKNSPHENRCSQINVSKYSKMPLIK
jgi:hypothetical protein